MNKIIIKFHGGEQVRRAYIDLLNKLQNDFNLDFSYTIEHDNND